MKTLPPRPHRLQPQGPLAAAEVRHLADIIMVMQRCFMTSLSEELARGQVSFPQFFLLGHLSAQGQLGMKQVAERMTHSTPAATGLVQRLEKLDYVKRSHPARDRRMVMVKITPKGSKLVARIRRDMIHNLTHVMGLLNPTEQRTWLNVYQKIHDYCTRCTS